MNKGFKYFFNNFYFFNIIRRLFTPYLFNKKKERFLFEDSKYFKLNLGCNKKNCYGYVNIDEVRRGRRAFISSFHRLPFSKKSVKRIIIDYNSIKNKSELSLNRILNELSRVLVQGAIISLDNVDDFSRVSLIFKNKGFTPIFNDFKVVFNVVHFIYSKATLDTAFQTKLFYNTIATSFSISSERKDGSGEFSLEILNNVKEKFKQINLTNCLESIRTINLEVFLKKIKDLLTNDGVLTIEVYDEISEHDKMVLNFFDKATIVQFLTESGMFIKSLKTGSGIITAESVKESPESFCTSAIFSDKSRIKICLMGEYIMHMYDQLGFTFNGLFNAANKLSMECLLIEATRNQSVKDLQTRILNFKPDYILIVFREVLPMLFDIKNELKKIGTKVIYWFCDPEYPQKTDLSEIIDIMFLTNRGQLDEYRDAYNLKRVYYMPQGIDPSFMFYRESALEIYDIGFSGSVTNEPLHARRKELMKKLLPRYNVKMTRTTRNNIGEFYSQSKTVFGISDFFYDLCTSDRFYNALGCGAVYITGKFQNIELLAENKKHLLWFETAPELIDYLDYYLKKDDERKKIRYQAQELAHAKHTWTNRLRNILDITEGKTEEFYGFL